MAKVNRVVRVLAATCAVAVVAASTAARAGSSDADGTYELLALPGTEGELGETLENSAVFEVRDGVLSGIRTQRYYYPDSNNSCVVSIQIFDESARIEGSTISGSALHRQTWNGSIAVDLPRDECATTDGSVSETIPVSGEVSGSTISVDAYDEATTFGDEFTLRRVGDLPDGPASPTTGTSPPSSGGGGSPTTVPPDLFTAFTDSGFSRGELQQLVERVEQHAARPVTLADGGLLDWAASVPGEPTPDQRDAISAVTGALWLAAAVTHQGHPVMPSVAAARPVIMAMAGSALRPDAPPDQARALVRTVRLLVGMDLARSVPP